MLKKAFVCDLDHTLLDTDHFFNVQMRSRLCVLNSALNDKIWEQSAARAVAGGYTLERHLDVLSTTWEIHFPAAEISTLRDEFDVLEPYVYDDVLPNLRRAQDLGYTLVLASWGNPQWQAYKVARSGLGSWFPPEHVIYTAHSGTKIQALAELCGRYGHIVFVDNNGAELDAAKATLPTVETWHISRVPEDETDLAGEARFRYLTARAIANEGSRLEHRRCRSLSEINL